MSRILIATSRLSCRIECLPDLTHASFAKLPLDEVSANCRPDSDSVLAAMMSADHVFPRGLSQKQINALTMDE